MKLKLFTPPNSNPKITKSNKKSNKYLSAIMHLFPGAKDICPSASRGCKAACLGITSGRAGIRKEGYTNPVLAARQRRTELFRKDEETFFEYLYADIEKLLAKAEQDNLLLALRLNGTSDIAWEEYDVMTDFPEVQFYDYTKRVDRMISYLDGEMPFNYHLTFSRSENNDKECFDILEHGGNIAAVFYKGLPDEHWTYPVFDGDETDLRFTDPDNVIVGLRQKTNKTGKEIKDNGFIIKLTQEGTII